MFLPFYHYIIVPEKPKGVCARKFKDANYCWSFEKDDEMEADKLKDEIGGKMSTLYYVSGLFPKF